MARGEGAELEERQDPPKITAEVYGVRRDCAIAFGRYGAANKAMARADAPGGREADAERLAAVIKALTGRKPEMYRTGNKIMIDYEGHLEGFMRYAELADAIEKWLEETRR